ncbi:MAG: hypothetical protein Q8936_18750 [Bacillota bacterium]|nr:hypothetical protein [Bacillota bacterium]
MEKAVIKEKDTLSTIAVDIEAADLIITGDHVFCNVVYLCYSTPEMIREIIF